MNDLNEKLAELCGLELRPVAGQMTISGVAPCWCFPKGGYITQKEWNPTQDLNQLKMCWEALSEDERDIYHSVAMSSPYVFVAPQRHAKWIAEIREKSILKAKGVSL